MIIGNKLCFLRVPCLFLLFIFSLVAVLHRQIEGIRVAGSLHDLGMIGVPGEILSSPRTLTDYEFALIKTHPVVGYNILKDVEFPWSEADIIVQHHKRMDGSGYPYGVQREAILPEDPAVVDTCVRLFREKGYQLKES